MSALSSSAPAPAGRPSQLAPVKSPEPSKSFRGWWISAAILLLIVGAAFAYRAWARAVDVQTQKAAVSIKTAKAFTGPLEVTLRMAGQTSARNFNNIVTPLLRGPESRGSMTLLQLAGSGALVKKGELIAQIDAQSVEDHMDDIKDTIQQAQNDVLKRKAEQAVEWENVQQNMRVAKAAFDKAKFDFQPAPLRTDIERELLKISMDEAEARYKQVAGDMALQRQTHASEIRILEITLDRHQRHYARHSHDREKFTIRSSMAGLAVMSTVFRGGDMGQIQKGDQVYPGQPIMKVVDPKSMQVEASVSQSDSNDLRLGQRVRIGLDAFSGLDFTGKVYSIGALAVGGWRQNNFIRNVPVRVAIDGFDPKLIPDLSAHCDVILETVPDQVQIPVAAVHEEKGEVTVSVRDGDGWTVRRVKVGRRNNTHVAVVQGLKAGEEVRLN
jgi:HlyD family secretion protein